ncbi:hypothetical protein RHMOL_Rhmol03G0017300 [Rhododendron molle]|uniref:Uncharacterized protein n=1 Tax=Rhododendron molle TaxID=49168 RepID=A0ACC0PAJ4_RHOML|nr:hypothetical protein RHMOL_Rhmol03G0017300 [Rhododendron molle]
MVEEESTPVARPDHVERVEFMPPLGSSSHEPIMSSALVEYVGPERLAQLMREAPHVVEVVEKAREERLAEIARWNEEQRLIREAEARAQEAEPEQAEVAQEEGLWMNEVAVTLANVIKGEARRAFVAETYTPPEPHVFIPSGAEGYHPLRRDYNEEDVLRDRDRHLSRGWAQVYPQLCFNFPSLLSLAPLYLIMHACELLLE